MEKKAFSSGLRVASYNIRHGADVQMNMQILADDITGLGIDVVGLQEVDIGAARSGCIDTMAELSAASGMPAHAFARGIPLGEGEYGTGILSRLPMESFTATQLFSGEKEQRAIGHAVMMLGERPIHFFNTHLSFEEKSLRDVQFVQVAEMLPKDEPWILTGDFNTDDFAEFSPLGAAVMLNRADNYLPSFRGRKAIDNIVLSADWAVGEWGMLSVNHSDHEMIWCDIVLR